MNKNASIVPPQVVYAALFLIVIGLFIFILFKLDILQIKEILPNWGTSSEDKIIDDVQPTQLKGKEVCCCLYEGTINTGNCLVTEIENEKYCKDVFGLDWVNVDNAFCILEKICQYGNDDDKDGKIDCADEDCDSKSCGGEKICIDKECVSPEIKEKKPWWKFWN